MQSTWYKWEHAREPTSALLRVRVCADDSDVLALVAVFVFVLDVAEMHLLLWISTGPGEGEGVSS